jgi:hypothetical protein
MSPAIDVVERLVVQKKLRHNGAHSVLQWCAANAVHRNRGPHRMMIRA